MKSQVKELKSTLEKFMSDSMYLNMILGSQRAVYNKSGLGYKSKISHKSYISLVNRQNNNGKIPKHHIHYVNLGRVKRNFQNCNLAGTRNNLFHNHIR